MSIALVEPAIVPDVFINGIQAEDMGDGTMRFLGYCRQRSLDFDGYEFVVINKVYMPIPAVMISIKETMRALGLTYCGGERLALTH